MIVYFADRKMEIIGLASTKLPGRFVINDDKKVTDLAAGVTSFEFYLNYKNGSQSDADMLCTPGNYLMCYRNTEHEFYTIIDSEEISDENKIYIYAEDAGLDLLNELVDPYAAPSAQTAAWYIERFTFDSGFKVGVNEISSLSRKLEWEGEATVAERILSVATNFDAELSYSFEIEKLQLKHKYINLHKRRGKDIGMKLRKGYEINKITKKRSIANLATSVLPRGGTPEGSDTPIDLRGYAYDDGDIYLNSSWLTSRSALRKWSRYTIETGGTGLGEIITRYSYDTLNKQELCTRAVNYLKKIMDMQTDYDIELAYMPKNLGIGDTVTAIDGTEGIYLTARVIKMEESATNEPKITIGDYLSLTDM